MSALERFARRNYSTRSRREGTLGKSRPAPIQTLEVGYPKSSLFDRPKDIIMNQLLTPTIRHFSFDGASIPFSKKSPWPRMQSAESLQSDDPGETEWDKSALQDLSNSIRASIRHDESIGPDTSKLSVFLEIVLKDEERRHPTMGFETIEHARLDKLLDELIQFAGLMKAASCSVELPLRFRVDIAHCKKLRVLWRHRFREQYALIDQFRCALMVKGGRLKQGSSSSDMIYDLGLWQTDTMTNLVGEVEGNQQFEAGHWWLNNVCAHRDGIVGCPLERPTSGRYGITALPLLTGREELIRRGEQHVIKYIREGSRSGDMHIPIISEVGRQIRVLRGYRLKSIFAPEAGVRYDGLYIVRQYGTKLNEVMNIHRLVLTLERVQGQETMECLKRIPKPSQLDDWKLYEKLEGDKIKLTEGEAKFFDWTVEREEERLDRADYVRDRQFRASFSWKLE
ncbi:hypothetical protein BKA67DRAFT_654247 [Truncatella angustata]|uniref:YDG domain-containing protein n=1 Tax=Truncatella angustata TaxID=152316 RepID=A0A9P8UZ95_9PEZI|nr:uncharacterized protein BKA67DRAFT_654247 [Truncatella angustata]KAH6661107.1 hypothetical protein BKA67DRAFT_654247 [Truncatella angustata]